MAISASWAAKGVAVEVDSVESLGGTFPETTSQELTFWVACCVAIRPFALLYLPQISTRLGGV
jgi:hypothetical protein